MLRTPSGSLIPPVRTFVWSSLASRILILTVAFVMIAELAIYVPSIANFRNNWLRHRLTAARTAAFVFDAAPDQMIPAELKRRILDSVGTRAIVLRDAGATRLLAASAPPRVDETTDLRDPSDLDSVIAALRCLFAPPGRIIDVIDEARAGSTGTLEITLSENPLAKALRRFSIRILMLSLVISAIVATLAVAAIHVLVLRPVHRLTRSIVAFGESPEDPARIIEPSGRSDEIGRAERALGIMQAALVRELSQKKNLASLGLAVAKINHDLRNMLSAAQLFSDRLSNLLDPVAQRLAPKLVETLDRAIGFCEATLTYGRVVEPTPKLRRIALKPLVDDVAETVAPTGISRVAIDNQVADGFEITADADQLFRVLMNLCRNAVQALDPLDRQDRPLCVTVAARGRDGHIEILVSDTGPGIPARARKTLFEPFVGSTRPGGTGLGLAIAADLVRAHGGSIMLLDDGPGATFQIRLPEPAVDGPRP